MSEARFNESPGNAAAQAMHVAVAAERAKVGR